MYDLVVYGVGSIPPMKKPFDLIDIVFEYPLPYPKGQFILSDKKKYINIIYI